MLLLMSLLNTAMTDVALVHELDAKSVSPWNAAVCVRSTSAKFMPDNVTSVPPVRATLAEYSNDATGASHVKACILVPTTAETVTTGV